jgi:quinol monooxygenase YgiN
MPLTILAQITAAAGQEEAVRTALTGLVAPTRAEPGCITYDLHVDNTDPGAFMFYETWETRDLWQDHNVSAHIKAFQAATKDQIAVVAIHEMTQIA